MDEIDEVMDEYGLNDLDELDAADPLSFWQKKQRELITSVVDYNLGSLANLISDQTINLSPDYQRRFRWDLTRQSKLIESFLMNVPIPPIFLNEDEYGKYSVIDGKQRLHAISEFFNGTFALQDLLVFSELNGLRMVDLPKQMQTALKTRPTLRTIIILRQSDPDVQLEVFQRLNSGGIMLNPQEVRNSAYPGSLNNLILELSTIPTFHRMLGIPRSRRSSIYDEMRDAELVLRYFTFKDNWQEFHGSMKSLMDQYMRINRSLPESKISELRHDFTRTIRIVDGLFGEYSFRRFIPEKATWRRQVLASLYDAEMLGTQDYKEPLTSSFQVNFIQKFMRLFEDSAFQRSMEAATNNAGNFRSRIVAVRSLLTDLA